jgi:protein-disulfide isomerase
MLPKLAIVALVAVFSLSGPVTQQDEVAALRKEVEAMKAQQAAMQRDLAAIKQFLQLLAQGGKSPEQALLNKTVDVTGIPVKGSPTASVMIVEVSDYHCPFCRRFRQQTQPEIEKEYITTGKVRYAFIDYPIEQLHPDAFRAHEAANCAGDQGKYWEMSTQLFSEPVRDVNQLVGQAERAGANGAQFRTCLEGGKYKARVKDSVARMQELGIDSTPNFLIGRTPSGNEPMKVLKVVRGAMPFAEFKTAIDSVLQ